jgi:hypothetical protein
MVAGTIHPAASAAAVAMKADVPGEAAPTHLPPASAAALAMKAET